MAKAADPELAAKKSSLTRRLTREGRMHEARRFMEGIRKTCAKEGLGREAAVKTAWEECERNYPPMSREELALKDAVEDKPSTQERMCLPRSWGEIPESGKAERDAEWVYANYARVVQEVPGKASRLRLGRASGPAPSQGAISLLKWAAKHEHTFFGTYYPKVVKGLVDTDTEQEKRERKSIGEIRRIIEQMEGVK